MRGRRQSKRWELSRLLFDRPRVLERRWLTAPEVARPSVRLALRYLYLSNGPQNMPRGMLKIALGFLSAAERKAIGWLQKRTNGHLKRRYGKGVLVAARRSKLRCEDCGIADVRVLNLDHVDGLKAKTSRFRCICANCHTIKSLNHDW